MQCDVGCCNLFATLLYHICNSCVTRVSQNRTDVKRFRGCFAERIQIFLNFPALLSQLKRNKRSENVTVVLRFSPKSAKCNRFRTLLGTLECVLFCIFLYLYALICIIEFLCTLLWRYSVFPSLLLSHGKQIGAAVQYPAQQLLYKKAQKEAAAQRCATASHNSGYAIELCSGAGDHRAAFAASICLMSSGTTLNRSPTMP